MLYKALKRILCVIFVLLMSIVFYQNYIMKRSLDRIAFSLFVILVFFSILYLLTTVVKPTAIDDRKKWIRHIIIANLALFTIQLVVTFCLYFTPGYDGQFLMESSSAVAQGASINDYIGYYLSSYNNAFMFCILVWLKKVALLFGIQNLQLFVSLATTVFTNISCFFVALCLERFTKKRILVDFGWFLYAFYIVLCPWSLETYTNAYSFLFPVVTLYLFLSRNDQPKQHNIKIVGMVATAVVGYWMKPTNIIVLIAIGVYATFVKLKDKKLFHKRTLKQGLATMVVAVASSLMVFVPCFLTMGNRFVFITQSGMPAIHYFMMGLNTETTGCYLDSDNSYTISFETKVEKEQADLLVARQRLNDFGAEGYIQFLGKKLAYNYYYFALPNGPEAILSNPSPIRNAVVNFFMSSNDAFYQQVCRCLWLCILVFFFVSCFPNYKDEYFVVLLTIFGITLFTLLFEASSRQFILYGSFYCMAAMVGFDKTYESIRNRNKLKQ